MYGEDRWKTGPWYLESLALALRPKSLLTSLSIYTQYSQNSRTFGGSWEDDVAVSVASAIRLPCSPNHINEWQFGNNNFIHFMKY